MTTAASSWPQLGTMPVGNFFQPDSTQRHKLGATLSVVDPYYGGQELIYLQVAASTALNVGHAVTWDVNNQIIALPNTANQGVPVAFALNAVASSSSVQYGWFLIEGQTLCWSNASVAAAALIGVVAAGQLGANSAGKEILNARVAAAATTTVAKANTATQSGSNVIRTSVAGTDGWFVGMAMSGTGIAASSVITAIDPDNRTVTLNNNATATGSVTVTGTRNDGTNFWNLVVIDRPFAQGAIT